MVFLIDIGSIFPVRALKNYYVYYACIEDGMILKMCIGIANINVLFFCRNIWLFNKCFWRNICFLIELSWM